MERYTIPVIAGWLGAVITVAFGEWNAALTALLVMMICDYISGLVVAGIFKKSEKTETGGLNSSIGVKGFVKKVFMLVLVAVANQCDRALDMNIFKSALTYGLCANEIISLIENCGLMGIPIPNAIRKAFDILKDKGDGNE